MSCRGLQGPCSIMRSTKTPAPGVMCAPKCPEEAISGEKKTPHVLDQEKCIKCGICYEACKFDAIKICLIERDIDDYIQA